MSDRPMLDSVPGAATRATGWRGLASDPLGWLERARAQGGMPIRLQLGRHPVFIFSSPTASRAILLDQEERLSARDAFGPFSWMVGWGLVRMDGASHRSMRRLLLPAFHQQQIARHITTITRIGEEGAAAWIAQGRVDGMVGARALTLRVVARLLFDLELAVDPGALGGELAALFDSLMIDPARPRTLLGTFRMLPLPGIPNTRARLDRRLYRLIAQRRASGATRADVLGMLLEAQTSDGRPLSAREVRDQLITFLVAGHDTTAMGLTWALYELARRPALVARLRVELEEMLGEAAPTVDGLRRLPRLTAVVDETLRLYPPIPLGIRRATAPLEIEGEAIPAGATVLYSPYLTHRDPALWPDPDRFDPDRFLVGRPPPYHYLPFGGGAHQCIGMTLARMELQLLLLVLLRRLDWQLVDPAPPARVVRPTLAPRDGLPLRVRARAPAEPDDGSGV